MGDVFTQIVTFMSFGWEMSSMRCIKCQQQQQQSVDKGTKNQLD